eukprot:SAG22_NODE_8898_length_623_cov_0.847328_1_plen_79_part_01
MDIYDSDEEIKKPTKDDYVEVLAHDGEIVTRANIGFGELSITFAFNTPARGGHSKKEESVLVPVKEKKRVEVPVKEKRS